MADAAAPPAEAAPASTATAQPQSTATGVQGGAGQDASIGLVTQTYSNYVNDIQAAVEGLRQRAVALQAEVPAQIQQLQSQIEPQTQELVNSIKDTEAPIALAPAQVVELMGWSSILLLAMGIASMISAYLLSPILGVFLGRFGAGLLASVILPISAAYYLREADGSTAETRSQLLYLAVGQGLLLGHAIAYSYIAGQPLGFITPLVIAFAYPLVAGQVGNAHAPLLGGVLGASFAAQFVVGLVGGQLSGSYLILASLYTAASAVTLQIAFKNLQAPNKLHLYQILLVGSFLFSKALVYGLLGGAAPGEKSNVGSAAGVPH